MIATVFAALLLGVLPGAALLRLPIVERHRREALDPAERAFWAVAISLAISLGLVMLLAAAGSYRLRYVLIADALIVAAVLAGARRRLRYERPARPTWWTAAPVGLVALTLWVFPPPAEYVVGGKDPGVYLNAGVQIAQRGNLIIDRPGRLGAARGDPQPVLPAAPRAAVLQQPLHGVLPRRSRRRARSSTSSLTSSPRRWRSVTTWLG